MIRQAAGITNSREENIALSKALARLLRHRKPHNIPIDDEGYALIDHILQHREFARFNTSVNDINHLVVDNSKKRFEVEYNSAGKPYKIRATQGHTVQFRKFQLELITDPHKHGVVVHGTYKRNWRVIKKEGLSRLKRTHIHFAIGLIGQSHVTSGMRSTCDVIIYLDMEKAMRDGLKFYESSNNVVLSEGNESGMILPKYFSKVTQWNEKQRDWLETEYNKE